MVTFNQFPEFKPVMIVKTMIGIQTTAREVSRGCEAAVQRSPAEVTVLSSASALFWRLLDTTSLALATLN